MTLPRNYRYRGLNLFDIADQHRAALLRDDAAAARRMYSAYRQTWVRIRMETDDLLRRAREAQSRGEETGPAWLTQFERLASLQRQVEAQIRGFAAQAGEEVHLQQGRAVFRAQEDATALLEAAGAADGSGVALSFSRLPQEALTQLVGQLADDSPLNALLAQLPGQAGQMVADTLTAGLGAGLGTTVVARQIRDAVGPDGITMRRARTIARTEMMRAYRESASLRYQANSDVLGGWIWTAGLGPRCCAACAAMHGSKHGIEERLDGHPNCRCVAVPLPSGPLGLVLEQDIESGSAWFARQGEETQISVLGSRKALEAYNAGKVSLNDFVGRRRSERWGTMRYRRPISAILQDA